MKTLAPLSIVLISLSPISAFPCSMPFGTSVTCGKISDVATKPNAYGLFVGVKVAGLITAGSRDSGCTWREDTRSSGDEIVPVASLPKRAARKIRNTLISAKERAEEVCIFSTFGLDPNYALVTSRAGRTTQEINSEGVGKFSKKIKRQIGE